MIRNILSVTIMIVVILTLTIQRIQYPFSLNNDSIPNNRSTPRCKSKTKRKFNESDRVKLCLFIILLLIYCYKHDILWCETIPVPISFTLKSSIMFFYFNRANFQILKLSQSPRNFSGSISCMRRKRFVPSCTRWTKTKWHGCTQSSDESQW